MVLWKTFFFIQSYCYADVWCNCHVVAIFKNKCFERSPYFMSIISTTTLQSVNTTKSKIKLILNKCSSQNFFLDKYFLFFQLMNVSHFFLVNGIFKT